MADGIAEGVVSREQLIFSLYEAAELEHNLMCTYLYGAFSLKDGEKEGLSAVEAEAVKRWRQAIIDVAIEEMGHLSAVWNITSALGGSPRFGRMNFPLDIGYLPAGIVVKLAPFNAQTLQHFIHLERPIGSDEPDGEGYTIERTFLRGSKSTRLTPMPMDYDTVGEFYETISKQLKAFSDRLGEDGAFIGDRKLQLSPNEIELGGAKPVICLKTALQAFDAIVVQGEGAPGHNEHSHFSKFAAIREELKRLKAANPHFEPAHPAATNPVLRRPPKPEGRVWLEDADAVATVDLANAIYGQMLRFLGYAYTVPNGPEKSLAVDLGIGLMRAATALGEHAARLPAGPSNPHCNAGMSFATLRDAAPLPPGTPAWLLFSERLSAFATAAERLKEQSGAERPAAAARVLRALAGQAERGAKLHVEPHAEPAPKPAAPEPVKGKEITTKENGIETVVGEKVTIIYEGKRCIHSRQCVTGAPTVFLANVQGPWIHPNTMDAEKLVAIAEVCPSGAIRYQRNDGRPEETAPPVNLAAIREGGPYAVKGDIVLDGQRQGFRMTLCRCGASKNKPFCDGSHHDIGFNASGEPAPANAKTDMLEVRDGPLAIDPQLDGPLRVRGNLEITAGTGKVVARIKSAYLCRCGGSANKPFCDGTHTKIGFKS
ncbi:MAG: ferritin-like domain-containing protein [Hyphomonadaceae bacterium]